MAGELGNSAAVVHRHYRELVTPDDAKARFSIRPEAPDNLLTIPNAMNACLYYTETIHKHVSGPRLSGPEWHLANDAWQRCFAVAGASEAAAIAPPGSELSALGHAERGRAEAAVREAQVLAPLHATASDATPPEGLAQIAAARLPAIKRTGTMTKGDQKGGALRQAGLLLDDARTNQARLQAEFADLVAVGMGFEGPTVSVTDMVESTKGRLSLLPSRRNRGSGKLSPRAIQKALKAGLSDAVHAGFASTNRVPVKALERVRWQRWLGSARGVLHKPGRPC